MVWLTLLTTLGSSIASIVSSLLKDTSVVLILLGISLGFHFGDDYGRWRQAKSDAVVVKSGGAVQPQPRTRPIRDLIHVLVGDPPDEEE